jgi:hypothetical protein
MAVAIYKRILPLYAIEQYYFFKFVAGLFAWDKEIVIILKIDE